MQRQPTELDRWILRLICASYELGHDDAEQGECSSAFYGSGWGENHREASRYYEAEKRLLREIEATRQDPARSGLRHTLAQGSSQVTFPARFFRRATPGDLE